MQKLFAFLYTQRGFTLIELSVVLSIMATLIGLVSINLLSASRSTSLSTQITTLVSDLRLSQLQAMGGDTKGSGSGASYGIHFDQDQYVLFKGATYAVSAQNSVVKLDTTFRFATPGATIVFTHLSGETGSATSAAIVDITNNTQKTIYLNTYGVITGVQ